MSTDGSQNPPGGGSSGVAKTVVESAITPGQGLGEWKPDLNTGAAAQSSDQGGGQAWGQPAAPAAQPAAGGGQAWGQPAAPAAQPAAQPAAGGGQAWGQPAAPTPAQAPPAGGANPWAAAGAPGAPTPAGGGGGWQPPGAGAPGGGGGSSWSPPPGGAGAAGPKKKGGMGCGMVLLILLGLGVLGIVGIVVLAVAMDDGGEAQIVSATSETPDGYTAYILVQLQFDEYPEDADLQDVELIASSSALLNNLEYDWNYIAAYDDNAATVAGTDPPLGSPLSVYLNINDTLMENIEISGSRLYLTVKLKWGGTQRDSQRIDITDLYQWDY